MYQDNVAVDISKFLPVSLHDHWSLNNLHWLQIIFTDIGHQVTFQVIVCLIVMIVDQLAR